MSRLLVTSRAKTAEQFMDQILDRAARAAKPVAEKVVQHAKDNAMEAANGGQRLAASVQAPKLVRTQNSITYEIWSTSDHAGAYEFGRGPGHLADIEAIKEWTATVIKPEPKDLQWVAERIQAAIYANGTPPHFFLHDAILGEEQTLDAALEAEFR